MDFNAYYGYCVYSRLVCSFHVCILGLTQD